MTMPLSDTPLGRSSEYVDTYTPALLCPVPRWDAREDLELEMEKAPFNGVDVWTAYELSWLDQRGKPVVAMAEIRVPCHTRHLIESKSLKLYLNSFANSRIDDRRKLVQILEDDLSQCAGGPVEVHIQDLQEAEREPWLDIHGTNVDNIDLDVDSYDYDPQLLMTEQGPVRNETLFSHLLRSRCPVTGQPDWATVLIRYSGEPISHASFLRYVISLRNHQGFHEQIIERIWLDVMRQCKPAHLTVYGRFTRRGGIDINPFRSNFEDLPVARRTVRQ